MSGYTQILEIRRLEERVTQLGFKFANARHSDHFGELLALVPKDAEAVPIYCRDAEVFVGTLKDLQYWLRGVEWARDYDRMLKVSSDDSRGKMEQKELNRQLLRSIKEGVKIDGNVGVFHNNIKEMS
jgi:hypothetical protein